MADIIITAQSQEKAGNLIVNSLIKAGVRTALLIDSAGNVLANCGHEQQQIDIDAISLAALAAASLAATSQTDRRRRLFPAFPQRQKRQYSFRPGWRGVDSDHHFRR